MKNINNEITNIDEIMKNFNEVIKKKTSENWKNKIKTSDFIKINTKIDDLEEKLIKLAKNFIEDNKENVDEIEKLVKDFINDLEITKIKN